MSPDGPWFELVASVLATWRLARLLAREDGPFDLVVRLRQRAGEGAWGALMDCPYCLGFWLALPFALLLGDTVLDCLLLWLAIAGGAAFLENLLEVLGTPTPPS